MYVQAKSVIEGRCILENKGEVCFEEEVERMRRSGMSTAEISQKMGVDPSWVESLVSMWEGGKPSGEEGGR
jgi:predicted transposase YdaD